MEVRVGRRNTQSETSSLFGLTYTKDAIFRASRDTQHVILCLARKSIKPAPLTTFIVDHLHVLSNIHEKQSSILIKIVVTD
jgi:hypothetical protein